MLHTVEGDETCEDNDFAEVAGRKGEDVPCTGGVLATAVVVGRDAAAGVGDVGYPGDCGGDTGERA